MSAFLKKLVEKASFKKPGGFSDTLKPDDLSPRLVFHYGIPSGSTLFAYDTVQQILAISTKDGQIKLFGKDGSQAILESPEALPSKFIFFIENQGVLLNINLNNHIEAWDIERKCLLCVHNYEKEITSFAVLQQAPYMYVGDSTGSVSVLKLDQEHRQIKLMNYHVPFSVSRGKADEVGSDIVVKHILPLPTAETKRVLIIYSDGVIVLWSIQESNSVYIIGTTLQSLHQETKKVTAACWACSSGTKVAVGYNNGDIFLWSIDSKSDQSLQNGSTPICKLNLGYKADKIPIGKLKWIDGDGKSSRLYVLGFSDHHPSNSLQVVLLNEHTESRTIKLGLHPPESLVDMEITMSSIEQNKNRHDYLLLLGRSSHIYTYNDSLIERYLVQCQTKSSPSLPKEIMVKLPYGDSSITVTKFITSIPCMPFSADEDLNNISKNSLPLFPFEASIKDGNSNSTFSRSRNLFITGHSNGAINFWDASFPLYLPVASITQQSDSEFSLSDVPLTALHFNYDSRVLVSGDQSGMVRVYTLKSEPFAPQSSLLSFQGSSKKGSNHIIRRIKVVKVNGAVMSIDITENSKQLAVGSGQGYVSLIDLEGSNVLYQKHIASELSTGIISVNFQTCNFHGFEKDVIIVATKDSSISTLERDTGIPLSPVLVRPKKQYQALFTIILDGRVSNVPDVMDTSSDNSVVKQPSLLLCSEKAVYVYSLSHLIQGVKKVLYKKKFHSSCLWASTLGSPDVGLVLLFASGKIEIRSLPDLSLLKESSIRALTFLNSRPSSISVSSSHDGELVIVNGDQEVLFVSTLIHKETYRLMDSVSKVYNKDLHVVNSPTVKEKKKGLFSSVAKDDKAPKPETENSRQSIELSTIFSTSNFPSDTESHTKVVVNEEDVDLDIDDIDIDDIDPKEKTRTGGYQVMTGLNKMKISNKFQAIKGKLINVKAKNDKVPVNEEPPQDQKTGTVDDIKKKYGYASSGESSAANAARTKLTENLNKLQGINIKTTEMQDTARTFSSMAKEVLRFAENDKKGF